MADVTLKAFDLRALAALLLLGLANIASPQDRDQAEQDLSAVNSAIEEIQSWLRDAESRQSAEESQLKTTQLELSNLQQEISALEGQISTTQAELSQLQQQLTQLQEKKQNEQALLEALLRAAYTGNQSNFLKTLLNQESASEAARQLQYTRYFSNYQIQQIERFRKTLAELEAVNQTITATLTDLNSQQTELANRRGELDQSRQASEIALAELREDISSRSAEMEQLEINQAELQQLINEIARAMEGISSFDDISPLPESRGELPRPVSDSVVHTFGSRYGGGSLVRQGISFAPNPGSAVRAVHAGRVVFADWLRGSGLLVVLDHGEGYVSLYGHNEALAVAAGDWIEAGEVLATSGTNSGDPSAGLYFEIRRNGEPQNPSNWLR